MTERHSYPKISFRLPGAIALLFSFGLLFPIAGKGQAPERYQKVIINVESADELSRLPSFDDHTPNHSEEDGKNGIETILSESDVQALQRKGVEVHILIPDLQRFYAERAAASLKGKTERDRFASILSADESPEHFLLGSVAGNYSPQELENQLLRMRELYPALVSEPISIGTSTQGRDILAVRISARPESEELPEALYTGMHHAREPISMMSLVYTMWSALENYSRDPEITRLLESRSLWFIPLVNPDGYAYNIQYFPNGGGLWRKNRSGSENEGVDLNRNYGSASTWLTPGDGGANDPFSGNYRGPAPFSEPETRAIRDFVRSHDFRVVLNLHSYSNALIYKHSGSIPELADTSWYVRSARELALENGLGHGRGAEAIGYDAEGTADEWLFKDGNDDHTTFAWTPEIGSREDGFWPVPERIPSLCRSMLPMNIRAAWMAGPLPRILSWQSTDSNGTKALLLTVANVGTEGMITGGEIGLKNAEGTAVPFPPLAPGEWSRVRITLPKEITDLEASRRMLDLRIRYGTQEWSRKVNALIHRENTLFSDDFEASLSRWHMGLWDIETDEQQGRVLSDSPYEEYFESDIPNIVELAEPISLIGYDAAELQFDATVTTLGVYHALAIEARRSGERTWHRLDGDYLQSPAGEKSDVRGELRGGNRTWEHYAISLDQFAGEDVLIRFVMNTPYSGGSGPLFDGALVDNLKIVAARPIPTSVETDAETDSDADEVFAIWPNPCSNVLYIEGRDNHPILSLQIFDLLGREVHPATRSVSGSPLRSIDMGNLPKGTYILNIICDNGTVRKKILKREL